MPELPRKLRLCARVNRKCSNTLLGHLLQPKHDGIEVEAILSAKQPGTVYLAMRVARSERRPHRSEAKDQKQYFRRSGDSSFAMEHYSIEDAFRRVVVPELEFDWTTERVSLDGNGVETWHLLLQLGNNSRLTARYPYLHINSLNGAAGSGGPADAEAISDRPVVIVDRSNPRDTELGNATSLQAIHVVANMAEETRPRSG